MPDNPAHLLREHGLQVTAQRLAVLRAVSARPHCTADDVTEDARAEIGAISRQAVYDTLGILAESGLIRRIQPAGSSALYCWTGTRCGMVLAQSTNTGPTTQNGDKDVPAAAPHGESTAGSKC